MRAYGIASFKHVELQHNFWLFAGSWTDLIIFLYSGMIMGKFTYEIDC